MRMSVCGGDDDYDDDGGGGDDDDDDDDGDDDDDDDDEDEDEEDDDDAFDGNLPLLSSAPVKKAWLLGAPRERPGAPLGVAPTGAFAFASQASMSLRLATRWDFAQLHLGCREHLAEMLVPHFVILPISLPL